jgi:hypothetical protein
MDSVLVELARLVAERGAPLATPRACTVDLGEAPASVRTFVDALRAHEWNVRLMAYALTDEGDRPVESLALTLDALRDGLDHELEEVLAHAGADGGVFDPATTIELCPDPGGMSVLALSCSGGAPAFVVLEMDEDPNAPGWLTHLTTPGALIAYLADYLVEDDADRSLLDRLRSAAERAGEPIAPAAPIKSAAATTPPTRERPAMERPARWVGEVRAELDAAVAADDAAAVARALSALEGPLQGGALALVEAWGAVFAGMSSRPARSLQIVQWMAHQPALNDLLVREEWLKALATGCALACAPGDDAARLDVVQSSVPFAREKLDILHNAACAYVALGRHADALDAVAEAARLGYPALADLIADADLVPLRANGALDAAVARGVAARG